MSTNRKSVKKYGLTVHETPPNWDTHRLVSTQPAVIRPDSELHTVQTHVSNRIVKHYLRGGKNAYRDEPLISRVGGRQWLVDGTHRTVAARRKGKSLSATEEIWEPK